MSKALFVGLMSGTSLDGADAALVEFDADQEDKLSCKVLNTHSIPYSLELRSAILALQDIGDNELERSSLLANQLSTLYADCVCRLLASTSSESYPNGLSASNIAAIGCHGQTIRHRPDLGYTLQIVNPSLLAELTGIDVIADFRSRDVAAGGQGAPLVPAFHQAVFGHPQLNRVAINIGGIANISFLPIDQPVIGFDCGPGNMLMDAWAERHIGKRYDADGTWASTGKLLPDLLQTLLRDAFFQAPPPKSTGRDLFSLGWLEQHLQQGYTPNDVQRTLLELTATTIADAIHRYCLNTHEIYVCGGGAYNTALLQCLQQKLQPPIYLSDKLGIDVGWVEAAAFAWLARQTLSKLPGNLPAVTGAKGARILGALYAY